jgi:putative nucleotidyltransferase with HDIG domain
VEKDKVLKEIEKKIDTLPIFSPILRKVLEVIDDPLSSSSDIEKVIKYDQVLVAKVLKMANSAYYGYSGKISTVRGAIVVLGLNTLRALVFTASAFKTFSRRLLGYRYLEGKFWEHSVFTACGCRALGMKMNYKDPEEIFVGGLLHDIGKLILDFFVLKNFNIMEEEMKKKKKSWAELEREIIGIDHAQVGRRLSIKWNLPLVLQEAISYHHNPKGAFLYKEVPAIVNIVNNIVRKYNEPEKEIFYSNNHLEESLEILKIKKSKLQELEIYVKNSFEEGKNLLNI